jgi:small subunit ribosomal protein S2
MSQWIWWLIVLAVAALAGLLVWWLLYGRQRKEEVPVVRPGAAAPDDLTRIEGIGPKISGLLAAAGIATFAQLGATDVSRLRQILEEADLAGLADPSTWPEQARLANAGEWDNLGALQDELRGGRRE